MLLTILYFFLSFRFILFYMHKCFTLELEVRTVVSHHVILKTALESSTRRASVLHC